MTERTPESELRYTLQWRRPRSFRWRPVRSFAACPHDCDDARRLMTYPEVENVMARLAARHARYEFRIVEMPFNVLAAQVAGKDVR